MISLQFACSHFILSRNVIDTCLFDKPEKRSPGIAYRISLAIYRLGFIWSLLKVMSIAAFCNASWFTTWVVCFISNLIEECYSVSGVVCQITEGWRDGKNLLNFKLDKGYRAQHVKRHSRNFITGCASRIGFEPLWRALVFSACTKQCIDCERRVLAR